MSISTKINRKHDDNVLEVNNLSVNFTVNKEVVPAVKHVGFNLKRGETLALVGESGSGKSVTALSILQLLPYPTASHPGGSIRIAGKEVIDLPPDELRQYRGNRVSMIFQEPMTSLNPLHSVGKQIRESLTLHAKIAGEKATQRVLELLNLVGIPDPEERLNAYPHELSGGQRQRVMIAMALANEPDILIADEPTTALDVTIQAQILTLLMDLQKKLGMAILLITHDLGIVRYYSDRVSIMYDGEIVESGITEEIFNQPQHVYSKKLLAAEPSGIAAPVDKNADTLIELSNLNVWFPIKKGIFARTVNHVKAVKDVSLNVKSGQTLGIVGESGSGKTTLGLAVLRLLKSKGDINFLGQRIDKLNQKQLRPLRREIQMVFQDPFGSLSPRMSIAEIVGEGYEIHKLGTAEEQKNAIIEVLNEVGIDPKHKDRYPHEFSGGQRQRIAIARALILKPKLIVLDEPTSALDRTVQSQIIDLLRDLQVQHQLTYIFISHDLSVVKAISHNLVVMKSGEIVEQGTAENLFNHPSHEYTQSLIKAAFHQDIH